jgi:phenylalanyl-tRNA synthetase alpha chain
MSTHPTPSAPPPAAPRRSPSGPVRRGRRADLAIRDLTDPAAGPHAVQQILDEAVGALRAAWSCTARTIRAHPVVPAADNYDRLHYSTDAVARDARYTRYVDEHRVLRAHTSAMVPDALARLGAAPIDDELLVCVGMVYRRDSIDRLHTGTPHQVDLWRVAARPLRDADLDTMIATLVSTVLPGARWRTEPRSHPYTVGGRQIDVERDGDWIEIGECGLALPDLLAEAGIDPARHGGLALGLGLDRLVMLRKRIDDIRLLRATDPRIATQMLDLEPYRPVSTQPPVVRDLSIAADAADTAEDLGDRVRGALGDDARSVEAVEVVTETPAASVPEVARQRLGLRPQQKNLLVRVVLRDPDRTLTSAEANLLRDRIYGALHRGSRHQWAAGEPANRDGE